MDVGEVDGRFCYKLYKTKKGGKERELLAFLDTSAFVVDKDYIYAYQKNENTGYYIEKISLDGKKRENTEIVINNAAFNITDDQIYYSNAEDSGYLYTANKDGTQKRKVSDLIPISIYVLESKNSSGSEDVICLGSDFKWYDCYYSEPELIFEESIDGEAEGITEKEIKAEKSETEKPQTEKPQIEKPQVQTEETAAAETTAPQYQEPGTGEIQAVQEETAMMDSGVMINGVKYGNTPCNMMQSDLHSAVIAADGTFFESRYGEGIEGHTDAGSAIQKLDSGQDFSRLSIYEGYLYYVDNFELYRKDLQKDSEPELIVKHIYTYQIVDGIIYYTNASSELKSVNINDFTWKMIKRNVNYHFLSVEDNWIYFCLEAEKNEESEVYNYALYKIRTDGSDERKICDIPGEDYPGPYFCVVDSKIYYSEPFEGEFLLKSIDVEGAPVQLPKISMKESDLFQIIDGWIYYADSRHPYDLMKTPIDGSEPSVGIFNEYVGNFYQVGNRLHVYTLSDNLWSFYSIDFDGGNKTKIYDFSKF